MTQERILFCYFATLCVAASLLLYGCATMFNGSTQDVEIAMPRGTKIIETKGEALPLLYSGDYSSAFRLKRNIDYSLRFTYKERQVQTILSSRFEAGWLIPDYLTIYGLIVDGITGAWNSFDGIAVYFPIDSTKSKQDEPYIEAFDVPSSHKNIGGIIIVSGGYAGPIGNAEIDFLLPNFGLLGIGYNLTSRLTILTTMSGGYAVNILPRYTKYEAFGYFSSYQLESRFRFESSIYLSGGGGWTHVTSHELTYYTSYPKLSDPPVNKWMPTLFLGLGTSGTYGFLELRQTFGLSKIPLPNSEIGSFETTSLYVGLNLHF